MNNSSENMMDDFFDDFFVLLKSKLKNVHATFVILMDFFSHLANYSS
uniref:Uncharacterized protein n=1 Tax=Tetranychus urticae TaxID=32264 RepID=T1JRE8_TETUR